MSMPSPDRYPRRRTVPWRVLDTEALVIDPKAGLLYPLNSVAARIWELADGSRTLDAIVTVLVEEFDADEATIRADATRFVDDLATAGLLSFEATSADGTPR
jgi:hypothetical protein